MEEETDEIDSGPLFSPTDHRRFSFTSQLLLLAEKEQPLLLRSFFEAAALTMVYLLFLQQWAGLHLCYL
jgi:hypothetical protein